MTTKHSPLSALTKQAEQIAVTLKAAESGTLDISKVNDMTALKMAAARQQPNVKFAIAMDDKILTIEMAWEMIKNTSERGIIEYILKQMRETREN